MKKLLKPIIFFQLQLHMLFSKGSLFEKIVFVSYLLVSIGLFLYSYTQIDLGLVITRVPSLYAVEKLFQYIGYFNRPLSTELFIFLATIFLVLYVSVLWFARQKEIQPYTIWSVIVVVTVILTFSYNAFSYDLFNYIFDAKIVTHYFQNPYLHKALDYPQDPMLGFMHWTERTYPYGPLWLVLTVPLSFIGSNIFILTFFLFKMLISSSFLVTIYYLYKIFIQFNEDTALENLILFALNPLLIYECLVSSHNDIVMMSLSLAALYYLVKKKYLLSSGLLLFSIGIKFATVALIPIFLIFLLQRFENRSASPHEAGVGNPGGRRSVMDATEKIQRELAADYETTFSTPAGMRVLADLTSFAQVNLASHSEGVSLGISTVILRILRQRQRAQLTEARRSVKARVAMRPDEQTTEEG